MYKVMKRIRAKFGPSTEKKHRSKDSSYNLLSNLF